MYILHLHIDKPADLQEGTLTLFLAVFAEEYLQIDFDKTTFAVSALLHPSTYLNKILLGSEQGTLQLWNIRSK